MRPLAELTVEDLRQMYDRRRQRRRPYGPVRSGREGRARLVAMLEAVAPIPKRKQIYIPKKRKPPMGRQGVGRYICEQLSLVIGRTPEGFPIGLPYATILKRVLDKFPESAADELHMRWYANRMRAQGLTPPVHRERSHWK